MPQLYGREVELAAVHEATTAVAGGQGLLLLIRGEAGSGKTALVNAAVSAADDLDLRIITGRCFDRSIGRPFSLWSDLLDDFRRTAGDDWTLPLQHDQGQTEPRAEDRDELIEGMRRFVNSLADERPTLLVLEDVHWADPLSVDVLRGVARSIAGRRLLILATCRDELQPDAPFARALPAVVREATCQRIELPALTQDAIRRLVLDRYGLNDGDAGQLTQFLSQRTNGNPLLVQEMLHTLEFDSLLQWDGERWQVGELQYARVPHLVQQLVRNRMLRIDEASRRLIEFASVIGEFVPLDIWQAAGDASPDALDSTVQEAIEAGLITESQDVSGLRFTHALVRDAVYEAITLPRRRLWHEYVAESLASRHNADPDAVADHLQLAGRGGAAVEWLVRAGERALTLHATDVAVERATTAIELSHEWGVDLPLNAYHIRARGLEIQGALDAARTDYERAFELAAAADDTRTAWRVAIDLGSAWAERDYRQARRWFDRALELAEALDDDLLRARSLNRIGNWYSNREQPQRAVEIHEQAQAAFERSGDRAGIVESLDLIGIAAYLAADLPESAALYFRALPDFEELGDRRGLVTALAVLPITAGTVETQTVVPAPYPTGELLQAGERALQIAREIAWPAGEAVASIHLGLRTSFIGEYRRAWQLTHNGHQIATTIGHSQWRISASMVLGSMLVDMLSPEEAVPWLEPALAMSRDLQSLYWERIIVGLLGAAAIERGDFDEARRLFSDHEEAAGELRTIASRYVALQLGRLNLADGNPRQARSRLEALVASNRGTGAHDTPHVALVLAEALVALGDLDGAAALLRAAGEVADRRGEWPIVWRIAAARAAVESQLGRPDRSEDCATRARDVIDRLGQEIEDDMRRVRFLDRARERLPDTPVTVENPFGLSPREIEVLRLIAEGLRDREIADQLFISPRTVTNHVTSILQKMDVPSRAAAAAEAVRRDII